MGFNTLRQIKMEGASFVGGRAMIGVETLALLAGAPAEALNTFLNMLRPLNAEDLLPGNLTLLI